MPLRILRVLAQTRARGLLKSGPKQTLLPFPEGKCVIREPWLLNGVCSWRRRTPGGSRRGREARVEGAWSWIKENRPALADTNESRD